MTLIFSSCLKPYEISVAPKILTLHWFLEKYSYRTISKLSIFPKTFGKPVYNQYTLHKEPKLFKYLLGFRQNHNAQHAPLK